MPDRTYSLHERALHALMVLGDEDVRPLLSAFEWIAADPPGAAASSKRDRFGRIIYRCTVARFHLSYFLAGQGKHVVISDIDLES